jgi:hypothetical protein
VIESGSGSSAVPSLASIDRAFHEMASLPAAIDRVLRDTDRLRSYIECLHSEISDLRREKHHLSVAVEEMRSDLASFNKPALRRTSKSLKKDSQKLLDRLLPPSEDVVPDREPPPPRPGRLIARASIVPH